MLMRRSCNLAFATVLLFCAQIGAVAAEPVIGGSPQGSVIEFGIIKSLGPTERTQAPETLSGTQSAAHGPKFGEHTTRIPAKLGTSFGFWFLLTGITERESVELKKVVKHPKMKNSRGQDEVQYTTTDTRPVANGMVFAGAAYRLERPEELKPGSWTFEIFYHGKKLVSQSFTVYAAK
jgi:Domain of unknown function (DUF3859)